MGFFKKNTERERGFEQNSLPNLPPLPNFQIEPQYPQPQQSNSFPLPSLPSFPNSNFAERVNQDRIKDAINQEDYNNFEDLNIRPGAVEQMYPKKQVTMEMPEWNSSNSIIPAQTFERERNIRLKTEPLFIKLDKFENSISSLNEIKQKISDIESMLRNIRAIKIKEEKELNDWEREIETIKAKLDQIDKDLFKGV